MNSERDYGTLPVNLPIPVDDGAADHLPGATVPTVGLAATDGTSVELHEAASGTLVLYVYPRTGVPGEPLLPGWDEVPGARGCTPQNCAFRDIYGEITATGAVVYGLSSQPLEAQREFARREKMPYPLLNDTVLALAAPPPVGLALPTFETSGLRLYKRLTLIARGGRVEKVIYPVFPPGGDAQVVLGWLDRKPG